jgi:flagellar FliL protein
MPTPFKNRPGKTILLMLAGCAVLALAAGVGVGMAMSRRAHPAGGAKDAHGKSKHASKKKKAVETIYSLGEQVINLADTGMMRYAKLTVAIGFEEKVPEEKLKESEPRLRDAVISVMTRKRFTDLHRRGGLTRLKKEILAATEGCISEAKISEVYFEQFAMQ